MADDPPRKSPLKISKERNRWAKVDLGLGASTSTSSPSTSSGITDKGKRRADVRQSTSSMSSPARSTSSSPEPNCAICLGRIEDKSFANRCFHSFCRTCLFEWAKVKPECPVCRQGFDKIIYNVRSMQDYDEQAVPTRVFPHLGGLASSFLWNGLDMNSPELRSLFGHHNFEQHYHRVVTHPSRSDSYRIGIIIRGGNQIAAPHRRVLARGGHLTTPPGSFGADVPVDRQSYPPPVGTSDHRRYLYTNRLWAKANDESSSSRRESTPSFYRENPATTHRLMPFINRELLAVLENPHDTANLAQRILEAIRDHPIRSRQFRRLVEPYTNAHTDHFIHEFYCFARSVSSDISSYDRVVNYVPQHSTTVYSTQPPVTTPPGIRYEDESTSNSSASSSVHSVIDILDSEDEIDVAEPTDVIEVSVETSANAVIDVTASASANFDIIDDFDNPRPGPSGVARSTFFPDLRNSTNFGDDSDVDVGDDLPRTPTIPNGSRFEGYESSSSTTSDVEIIGFKKPIRERTPEIIEILSEDEHEANHRTAHVSVPIKHSDNGTSTEARRLSTGPSEEPSPKVEEKRTRSGEDTSSGSDEEINVKDESRPTREMRIRPRLWSHNPSNGKRFKSSVTLRSVVVARPAFNSPLKHSRSNLDGSRPSLKSLVVVKNPSLLHNMEDFEDSDSD